MGHVTLVGTREASREEFLLMVELGMYLRYSLGISGRSGKAPGSDQAWQRGLEFGDLLRGNPGEHQIFKAWKRFETPTALVSDNFDITPYDDTDKGEYEKARSIAAGIHPAWDRLSTGAKLLHTRNVYQVLGPYLTEPSMACLYCGDDDKHGIPKGGTRTAVLLAKQYEIPYLNIRGKNKQDIIKWIYSVCIKGIKTSN